MSLAAYENLPFNPAWKQEYFAGCLVETPREIFVHACLPVAPRALATPAALRPVVAADEHLLHALFCDAFADTIEFCDHPEARFRSAARDCLARFFREAHQVSWTSSRIALAPPGTVRAGQPIGAALVAVEDAGWALLDMLFVAPEWWRRGVASALVASVLSALHDSGWIRTLVSRYHLGNEASRAWHQCTGFIDEPDLQVARLRHRAARDEAERTFWWHEVIRLEALFESGNRAGAFAREKWTRTPRGAAHR